jgi:AhpD family alkylhydroperoxidase
MPGHAGAVFWSAIKRCPPINDVHQIFGEEVSHWRLLARHDVGTHRKKANLEPNRRKRIMTVKDPFGVATELMKKWTATSLAVSSSLEPSLIGLVEIRASQINGCANCINMHTKEARAKGETEQRIYLLSAWREAPCYTDRERAALAWTEALTRLSEGHALESARETLEVQFTEEEQVKLTLMINVSNGWNCIAVGFGLFADDPAVARAAAAKAAA